MEARASSSVYRLKTSRTCQNMCWCWRAYWHTCNVRLRTRCLIAVVVLLQHLHHSKAGHTAPVAVPLQAHPAHCLGAAQQEQHNRDVPGYIYLSSMAVWGRWGASDTNPQPCSNEGDSENSTASLTLLLWRRSGGTVLGRPVGTHRMPESATCCRMRHSSSGSISTLMLSSSVASSRTGCA